jgi:hypothetical protein
MGEVEVGLIVFEDLLLLWTGFIDHHANVIRQVAVLGIKVDLDCEGFIQQGYGFLGWHGHLFD